MALSGKRKLKPRRTVGKPDWGLTRRKQLWRCRPFCWARADGGSQWFVPGFICCPAGSLVRVNPNPNPSEGGALQHPIGLVEAEQELRLLLLGQKTRLCRFDVLQKSSERLERRLGAAWGNGILLTSRLNSSRVKPMCAAAML